MIAKTISSSNMTYIGQEESGVISFKGIPYAKPPVGKRRWKAPEDLDPNQKESKLFHMARLAFNRSMKMNPLHLGISLKTV
ncbi:carboxylesterase family protein [Heyndrickxia faecalis]|uniref:carboxylesterase family protein n=1 Tax=Heyndrickxia faecalis TaxID=2824910 RepID=UPI003D237A70